MIQLLGIADHLEQRDVLLFAVDGPLAVENLVAAVFAVRLREHHQFDVGRVALQRLERVDEIVDFVVGEREAQFHVCRFQRTASVTEDIDGLQRLGRQFVEEMQRVIARGRHAFRHAVVQRRRDLRAGFVRQRLLAASSPLFMTTVYSTPRSMRRTCVSPQ